VFKPRSTEERDHPKRDNDTNKRAKIDVNEDENRFKFVVTTDESGAKPRFVRGTAPTYEDHRLSTYEKHLALKDKDGNITRWPNPSKEALGAFLHRVGYPDRTLEGHSREEHISYFKKLLAEKEWIKRITEIGFNAGHSAESFLSSREDIRLVSFDIMLHPYSFFAKLFIDAKFPGRHTLVAGDSSSSIPNYGELHPNHEPFDLIFIDGDHTFERAFCDIYNMRAFAHPKTVLIVDNVAPHRGVGIQVYKAYRQALDDGLIVHEDHVEVGGYTDGFTVGRYKFEDSLPGVEPNYQKMERRIRICEISREMDQAQTLERLLELKQEMDELDQRGDDSVDDWARRDYDRHLARIQRRGSSRGGGNRGGRRY